MRTLRLPLSAASALVLVAVSMIPLVVVVPRGKLYLQAATDPSYTVAAHPNQYHFFDSRTLSLLRPAAPYLLLLLLLQCGAAYAISLGLSGSARFQSRSFLLRLSLSAVLAVTTTTVLWIHIFG